MFAAVVVATMAAGTTATLPARLDVAPLARADVVRRLEDTTVSLVSLGCDLGLNAGTGVAVTGDRVLTNRHVAERFRTLHLIYDGTPARMVVSGRVALSSADDVAVLRPGPLGIGWLDMAQADPRAGNGVWVSGYAHDRGPDSLPDGLVVDSGHVVDYLPGRDLGQQGRVMRLDVPVRPGMSGGAVLDEYGHLAGLVFAAQSPGEDGLVLPVSAIRDVLVGEMRGALTHPIGC